MARMPRGEPRSVPDPAGEQYEAMIRSEREKKEREAAANKRQVSLPPGAFSLFESRLGSLDFKPGPSPYITIGDQTYREIDDGKANRLIPVDLRFSPAQLAEQRRAINRAFLIAANPIGGSVYGALSLANVPESARDKGLTAGMVVDSLMVGSMSRRPTTPLAPTPPRPRNALLDLQRPAARFGRLNGEGQATSMKATVSAPMLGTGTKVDQRLTPPGWSGNGRKFKQDRSHLLAKLLGGSADHPETAVTLPWKVNRGPMRVFEEGVAKRAREGEFVDYAVRPLYSPDVKHPSAILMTAHSPKGMTARVVQVPKGEPR